MRYVHELVSPPRWSAVFAPEERYPDRTFKGWREKANFFLPLESIFWPSNRFPSVDPCDNQQVILTTLKAYFGAVQADLLSLHCIIHGKIMMKIETGFWVWRTCSRIQRGICYAGVPATNFRGVCTSGPWTTRTGLRSYWHWISGLLAYGV